MTSATARPNGDQTSSSAAAPSSSPGSLVPALPAPALALVDVTKRYAGRDVLAGVSLAVRPGELVALLGPNGAGKTTAVEILEGYRAADGGQARVLGEDPRRGGPALRARFGHMLQGGGLDPRSTPRDLLRLYRRFHADGRDPDELLSLVGLGAAAATRVRRLSGGERQRLALALAIVGEPEALILDEPTAGMDPEARRATRALIGDLRARGLAILMTTHDLADVERLADRVAVLHHGRIVAEGTPASLGGAAEPRLRLRLERSLGDGELATLASALGSGRLAAAPDDTPGAYVIDGILAGPAVIAAVAAWCAAAAIQILELRTSGGTLEDRYLALTDDRDVEVVA